MAGKLTDDEETLPCPECGGEVRGQGGYLSCECPAQPAPEPAIDLTNHHNALLCPYCNPKGLKFADPTQPETDALTLAYQTIERLRAQIDELLRSHEPHTMTRSCNTCCMFHRKTNTCHKAPPVRLPRKFDADATAGNRVRDETVEWGWPQTSPGDWCGQHRTADEEIAFRRAKMHCP